MDKVTNKDLYNLHLALGAVSGLKGPKFAVKVYKNRKILKEYLEPIQQAFPLSSDRFKEFDKKRIALCEEHCIRDKNGKPVFEKGEYQFMDLENFMVIYKPLAEEYKDAIEEKDNLEKQWNTEVFNAEADELELVTISLDEVPEGITAAQLESIDLILE